jgi:hypothetical protein
MRPTQAAENGVKECEESGNIMWESSGVGSFLRGLGKAKLLYYKLQSWSLYLC